MVHFYSRFVIFFLLIFGLSIFLTDAYLVVLVVLLLLLLFSGMGPCRVFPFDANLQVLDEGHAE